MTILQKKGIGMSDGQATPSDQPERHAAEEQQCNDQTFFVVTPEAQVLRMTNKELVTAYDPNEPDSLVAERLKRKSGDKAFLVWIDGTVLPNVAASVECLEELIAGYDPRPSMIVEGQVCRVMRIGEHPNVWVDANPMNITEPLRTDGTSAAGIPWSTISKHIRQLVVVGRTKCDPVVFKSAEQWVYQHLRDLDDDEADMLYPQLALKLRELTAAGEEPTLRVRLNKK